MRGFDVRYALSRRSRKVIRDYVAAGALPAFDFDGTLAPIVCHPELARMRLGTRALLTQLTAARTCFVLSGRDRGDLAGKLAGCGVQQLAGNHGADISPKAPSIRRRVRLWARRLALNLPPLEGLWVEDKGLSLTIHYRQCRDKAAAKAAAEQAASSLAGARVVKGKESVSLVAADSPHKGDALRAVAARLGRRSVVYVGDDETDEDAFGLAAKGIKVLGVRVGRKASSRAGYYLRDQREIDEFLRVFLGAFPAARTVKGAD